MQSVLVLHKIRSAHNTGSMFRTADAAGVSKIILSGYTPSPIDQFGRPRKDFIKVSLGAENSVPWEHFDTLEAAIKKLRQENYTVVAVELDPASIPLFDYTPDPNTPLAIVMGHEVDGLTQEELALCDAIVEIPMHGEKESLNVSVACGVALFALLR